MKSIYLNKYASYGTKHSLSDAVTHVAGRVKKDNWRSRLQGGIFGTVKPDKVILRHFHPWKLFSGGVQFEGSFTKKNGAAVLEGRFQLPKIARVFMNSWLMVTIFLLCYSLTKVELISIPVVMLVLWLGNLFIIRSWGKSDIEYVSQTIIDALQ
jgi:hypothetical protein